MKYAKVVTNFTPLLIAFIFIPQGSIRPGLQLMLNRDRFWLYEFLFKVKNTFVRSRFYAKNGLGIGFECVLCRLSMEQ